MLLLFWNPSGVAGAVTLVADVGAFTLTGEPVTFDVALNAAAGSFVLTASPAGLDVALVAGAGLFACTGEPADLQFAGSATLAADTGYFTLTGSDATLTLATRRRGGRKHYEILVPVWTEAATQHVTVTGFVCPVLFGQVTLSTPGGQSVTARGPRAPAVMAGLKLKRDLRWRARMEDEALLLGL